MSSFRRLVNDDENINNSNSNAVSLASLAKGPDGWLTILNDSTFATVATYVPTDVDSKIRGHCWHDPSDILGC